MLGQTSDKFSKSSPGGSEVSWALLLPACYYLHEYAHGSSRSAHAPCI